MNAFYLYIHICIFGRRGPRPVSRNDATVGQGARRVGHVASRVQEPTREITTNHTPVAASNALRCTFSLHRDRPAGGFDWLEEVGAAFDTSSG